MMASLSLHVSLGLHRADVSLGEQPGKQQPVQAALACMDALFDLCQVHLDIYKASPTPVLSANIGLRSCCCYQGPAQKHNE